MQCAVNERNTDPGGKYEHQVIWPPADSLSISAVAEGRVVLCVLRGHGHKHRHHTWDNKSQNYGTHIKAIHAWHPVFSFFFFLYFFFPHYTQITTLADLHCAEPWELELPGQNGCRTRTCVKAELAGWLSLPWVTFIRSQATNFFPLIRRKSIKKLAEYVM